MTTVHLDQGMVAGSATHFASRLGGGWLAGERLVHTPARHIPDIAAKLRTIASASQADTRTFASRLLLSALADLDRLATSSG